MKRNNKKLLREIYLKKLINLQRNPSHLIFKLLVRFFKRKIKKSNKKFRNQKNLSHQIKII